MSSPARKSPLSTLNARLKVIASGAKSSAKRYPQYLRHRPPQPADAQFAKQFQVSWDELHTQDSLAASWLGHCSTLLKIGSLTVLTDPVLSDRIGLRLPGFTLGPQRLAPPPLHVSDLPPIDLILLSHAHFDHLDRPTLKRLAHKRTTVITAARTRALVPRGFGHIFELDWNSDLLFQDLTIRAIEPQHWGARKAWDHHRGFNSYLLQTPSATDPSRILFAGDTAHTSAFSNLGPLDLAIFGIGAYNPWIHAHATPEQVWEMVQSSQAARVLPVHHSTFKLSDEPADEPLQRLLLAAGPHSHRVVPPTLGEIHRFSRSGSAHM